MRCVVARQCAVLCWMVVVDVDLHFLSLLAVCVRLRDGLICKCIPLLCLAATMLLAIHLQAISEGSQLLGAEELASNFHGTGGGGGEWRRRRRRVAVHEMKGERVSEKHEGQTGERVVERGSGTRGREGREGRIEEGGREGKGRERRKEKREGGGTSVCDDSRDTVDDAW